MSTPISDPSGNEQSNLPSSLNFSANSSPIIPAPPAEGERAWYVLRVQSGKEDKVRTTLEARVHSMDMGHLIFKVIVPTEAVVVSESKHGSKRIAHHKLYPGYVMVEMIKTEQSHYLVKNTSGVGDFAGAMTENEVQRMLLSCEQFQEKPKPKISFHKGQKIKIKDGQFADSIGIIEEVDESHKTVKVRPKLLQSSQYALELEFWQVESLNNSDDEDVVES